MEQQKSAIEQLLDTNNNDNITLLDENDREIEFEQVAVIPIGKQTYAVLTPITKVDGFDTNDMVVFEIKNTPQESYLAVVDDDKTLRLIYNELEEMYSQSNR